MHEITVCIVEVTMPKWFGLPKTYNGYDGRHGLREWSTTSTRLGAEDRWVPAKAVLTQRETQREQAIGVQVFLPLLAHARERHLISTVHPQSWLVCERYTWYSG